MEDLAVTSQQLYSSPLKCQHHHTIFRQQRAVVLWWKLKLRSKGRSPVTGQWPVPLLPDGDTITGTKPLGILEQAWWPGNDATYQSGKQIIVFAMLSLWSSWPSTLLLQLCLSLYYYLKLHFMLSLSSSPTLHHHHLYYLYHSANYYWNQDLNVCSVDTSYFCDDYLFPW